MKEMEAKVKAHPHVTASQFEQYAKTCVSSALTYFRDKFDKDDAPLRESMNLFQSARICDPTFLTNTSLEDAKEHLDFLCSIMPGVSEIGIDDELKRK